MVAGAALRRPRWARVFWDPGRQVHQDQRWGYAEDRYRLPGVIAHRVLMGGKMCTLSDSNADRLAFHASVNNTGALAFPAYGWGFAVPKQDYR